MYKYMCLTITETILMFRQHLGFGFQPTPYIEGVNPNRDTTFDTQKGQIGT